MDQQLFPIFVKRHSTNCHFYQIKNCYKHESEQERNEKKTVCFKVVVARMVRIFETKHIFFAQFQKEKKNVYEINISFSTE